MSSGSDDSKHKQLARRGSLHPNPEAVTDPLFDSGAFFDRRDLVQVKYEMLRSVSVDGGSVSQAARGFGFSRPTFYQAQSAFERQGLTGLLPAKKGPRRAHKLSEDVMLFVEEILAVDPAVPIATLAERLHARFGLSVHPRSITRALQKRRSKQNHEKLR